jgi:hypothetical protein
MDQTKNNKATPSKDTGAKDTTSNSITDYKYNPRVENPNPKASKNKAPSAGNIRGV